MALGRDCISNSLEQMISLKLVHSNAVQKNCYILDPTTYLRQGYRYHSITPSSLHGAAGT